MSAIGRRQLLASTACALLLAGVSRAAGRTISGALPWEPFDGASPSPVRLGPWQFFTHDEAIAIEAIVDRLVPADEFSMGGKEAGCAVFIDRQLSGPFGDSRQLYMRPPFAKGLPEQGQQSPDVPAGRYRMGLAALDAYCKQTFAGKTFASLPVDQQDKVLQDMETGQLRLPQEIDEQVLFELLLQNTMEGFFADPIYGGNRDMVSWKMLGFPGVRYDFRDHVEKHNVKYPLPPVSLMGRGDWNRAR
jgi:gluconate 2-dehydrogenase gamma chain